jgi:ABC-type phosphate transport system permease subunit
LLGFQSNESNQSSKIESFDYNTPVMSAEPNQDSSIERLLEKTLHHAETRWEYFSLTATEKISGAAAAFTGAMIVSIFAILILFFLCVGFAFWLGDYLDNRAGGFVLAGLLFVPFGVAAYLLVPPFVRSKVIQNMLQDEDVQNEK